MVLHNLPCHRSTLNTWCNVINWPPLRTTQLDLREWSLRCRLVCRSSHMACSQPTDSKCAKIRMQVPTRTPTRNTKRTLGPLSEAPERQSVTLHQTPKAPELISYFRQSVVLGPPVRLPPHSDRRTYV